jgi:hypothetical protein
MSARQRAISKPVAALRQWCEGQFVWDDRRKCGGRVVDTEFYDNNNEILHVVVDFDGMYRVLEVTTGDPSSRDFIRVIPEAGDPYNWSDKPPQPRLEPPPDSDLRKQTAQLRLSIGVSPNSRWAPLRRQQATERFADRVAKAVVEMLQAEAENVDASGNGLVRASWSLTDAGLDRFEARIEITVFDTREKTTNALLTKLLVILETTDSEIREFWQQFISEDDLRGLHTAGWTLDGTIGEQRLAAVKGRFRLS